MDAHARCINEEMQIAAVHALQAITHQPVPQEVIDAYPEVDQLSFGPSYIIPKPIDPRLRDAISGAVKQAAIDSGVARI